MLEADHRSRSDGRLEHLDCVRGVAALLVCVGHLRGFLFVNLSAITSPSIIEYAFYFMTALGHQAVIAFFALSGYLVGGPAFERMRVGRFVWREYVIHRLTRLWVVVIPALFLTFLFDTAGLALSSKAGYAGSYYNLYNSGPAYPDGIDRSLFAFVGNMLFLQTITTPIFGTNTPLWSLANEFWYYFVFPLGAFALFTSGRWSTRIFCGIACIMIAFWLPWEISVLGAIWLLGAVAFMTTPLLSRWRSAAYGFYTAAALALLVTCLIVSVKWYDIASDVLLGAAWAATLPVLATLPNGPRGYQVVTLGLSEISYTLYVVHFPFLALIVFSTLAPMRWSLTATSAATFIILLSLMLLLAWGFWWCFERNTKRIRVAIQKAMALPQARAAVDGDVR